MAVIASALALMRAMSGSSLTLACAVLSMVMAALLMPRLIFAFCEAKLAIKAEVSLRIVLNACLFSSFNIALMLAVVWSKLTMAYSVFVDTTRRAWPQVRERRANHHSVPRRRYLSTLALPGRRMYRT